MQNLHLPRSTVNLCLIILTIITCLGCNENDYSPQNSDEVEYYEDYQKPSALWGYINTENEITIDAIYDDTRDFSEGLAATNYQGRWGYIDQQGHKVVPFQYRSAFRFRDGIARVQLFDKSYHFINKNGKVLNIDSYQSASDHQNGVIRIKEAKGYYFLNKTFDRLHDGYFDRASDFSYGYAVVKNSLRYGAIDAQGETIIPFEYKKIKKLSEQYVLVHLDQQQALFNTLTGNITHKKDHQIIDLQEQTLAIRENDNLILASLDNEQRISLDGIDDISAAKSGLWIARKGQKHALMTNKAELLTDFDFDIIQKFECGRAAYSIDDKWGYLSTEGDQIIPPMFPLLFDYKDNFARVVVPGGIGMIDTAGIVMIPAQYLEIKDFSQGLARYQAF